MSLSISLYRAALLSTLILGSAAGLRAAPATEAGARALEAALDRYSGNVPGMVRAEPAGQVYRVTLDPAPMLRRFPGLSGEISPLRFELTGAGQGIWNFRLDQPLSAELSTAPDAQGFSLSVTLKIGRYNSSGVFDETLAFLREGQGTARDITLKRTLRSPPLVSAPDSPDRGRDVSYAITSANWRGQAVASQDAGVDFSAVSELIGLREEIRNPPDPAALSENAPVAVSTVERLTDDMRLTGLRVNEMLDLLRWLALHSDRAALAAGQDELRQKLLASLPLFDLMVTDRRANKLVLARGGMTLGAGRLQQSAELTGLGDQGQAKSKILAEEISARFEKDHHLAWLAPLIPRRAVLDLSARDFVAAAPVRLLIAVFSPDQPDPWPADLVARLLPLVAPRDVTLTLGALQLEAQAAGLEAQGKLSWRAGGLPMGEARVLVRGWDRILNALDQAPQAWRDRLTGPLQTAGSLARPAQGGEALEWVIDGQSQPGRLLVNGAGLAEGGSAP